MKASKLLSLDQRKLAWSEYIKLNMRARGLTFEKFLTKTIKL